MFRAIKRSVYLLQLENYYLGRYWRIIAKKFFPREKMRQKIVWTPKLGAVFSIGIILQILTAYLIARPFAKSEIYLGLFPLVFLFLFLLLSFFNFVFLSAAVLMLKPMDAIIKGFIVHRAKAKIRYLENVQLYNGRDIAVQREKNFKIIGITGSYGKTTMKEVLATILAEKFTILKTPESVNTPVGISRLILKSLNADIQIFIAEMGAYQRGDIRALCEIAKPDIAVLTGINEAHLERFGSIENTIMTKFEIVENAAVAGLVVLNADNELVKENYKKFARGRRVEFYSKNSPPPHPNPLLDKEREKGEVREGGGRVPLLGDYILGVINACVIIARELGMTDDEIRHGITNIKPIPHRLQRIENPSGITVIDDSYNGNPDGVREAIEVLAGFAPRRKIYITPGLVEMGERTQEIHRDIGKQLAGVADIVILIRNSVTRFIEEGIAPSPQPSPRLQSPAAPANGGQAEQGEGEKPQVIYFNSAPEAHGFLPSILKPGDVVLFQNDWPDNYL